MPLFARSQKSGLSEWLSEQLTAFEIFPTYITAAFLAFITAAITNVTSNAATATLFLPIVGKLVSYRRLACSLHVVFS